MTTRPWPPITGARRGCRSMSLASPPWLFRQGSPKAACRYLCSSSAIPSARQCSIASRNFMKTRPAGRSVTQRNSAAEPQATDRRKLDRRHRGVDANRQPEHVQLDALVNGDEKPGEPVERNLKPRAAWGGGKQRSSGQKILADRIGR